MGEAKKDQTWAALQIPFGNRSAILRGKRKGPANCGAGGILHRIKRKPYYAKRDNADDKRDERQHNTTFRH